MARNNARVNIPTNSTEQITLLGKVSAKHAALGAGSPLGSLKWSAIDAALADAKTHDDAASDLAKQAEKEYRDRDVAMPKVTQALRDARSSPTATTPKRSATSVTPSTTRPRQKPKPSRRPNPRQ